MHLDPGRGDHDRAFRAPAFHHRGQQFNPAQIACSFVRVRMVLRAIHATRGDVGERPHRLGAGPHVHQHPAHVGMIDDRSASGAADRPALHPLARVSDRLLVGGFRHCDALQPDIQARVVHHREHVFQAAVRFADKISDRTVLIAIRHDGGRRSVDAEFVFDRRTHQIVPVPGCAVRIDQELRRHEQRNATRARRRIRQACQHEVDDVLGDVVLAPGDEDLRPEQAIAVAVRLRPRADRGQVGPRARFGQVHRAGPLARDHFGQITLLQLVGRMVRQCLDRAHRQHLTQRERQVGGFPHLGRGAANQRRHALPADIRTGRHTVPAGVDELAIRRGKAVRRRHAAIVPTATLLVAGRVQRRQHFAGETGRLGQDRLDQFRFGVFKAGEGGDLRQTGQMLHHEAHVVQGCGIGHDAVSRFRACSRSRNFWILPVELLGIGPNTTSLGTLNAAICSRQN